MKSEYPLWKCLGCRARFVQRGSGRVREYCSAACRQAAYRSRKRDPEGAGLKEMGARREVERQNREAAEALQDQDRRDRDQQAQERRRAAEVRFLEGPMGVPQVRKLLLLAVDTDSQHEADTAIRKARELWAKARRRVPTDRPTV